MDINWIKTQPYSEVIENNIISILMQNHDLFYSCKLDKDDFYVWINKKIFTFLEKKLKKNLSVDYIILLDKFIESSDHIYTVMWLVPLTYNFDEYCWIIKTYSNKRKIINWLSNAVVHAYDDNIDEKIPIEIVNKTMWSLRGYEDVWKSFYDVLNSVIDNIWLQESLITATGFDMLDWIIWGFKKWQLVIVAWRPWMWKTNFALNLIQNVSNKTKVMMFSLEMRNEELVQRILSKKAKLLYKTFERVPSDMVEKQIQKAMNTLLDENINFYMNDKTNHIDEIVNLIKKEKIINGVWVVFIDQLQVMKSSFPQTMKLNHYEYITQTLKLLAKELDITIVLMCQLNRDVEKNHGNVPALHNLRDSWSIEQDADLVMLCHREAYYDKDTDDNVIKIIVAKQRNGVCWDIELWLNPLYMDIYNL